MNCDNIFLACQKNSSIIFSSLYSQGDCANEVETEQIVADADVSSLTSSSSKQGLVLCELKSCP